ncbi:hypothetical protein CDEF62S_03828 [Castellaniella defragrans]
MSVDPQQGGRPRLGVLGGMGPLAGAAFTLRLVQLTDASRDQEHISVILVNDPDVPDRSTACMAGGAARFPPWSVASEPW